LIGSPEARRWCESERNGLRAPSFSPVSNQCAKRDSFWAAVGAHFLRGKQHLSLKAFLSPNRWNTLITRTTLVETDDWKKKRDDLKAKRNSLFDEYLKRPHDFQLASAIKPIDDEIAVCTEKLNQEQRSARSNAT
jgi:hypothetical protein